MLEVQSEQAPFNPVQSRFGAESNKWCYHQEEWASALLCTIKLQMWVGNSMAHFSFSFLSRSLKETESSIMTPRVFFLLINLLYYISLESGQQGARWWPLPRTGKQCFIGPVHTKNKHQVDKWVLDSKKISYLFETVGLFYTKSGRDNVQFQCQFYERLPCVHNFHKFKKKRHTMWNACENNFKSFVFITGVANESFKSQTGRLNDLPWKQTCLIRSCLNIGRTFVSWPSRK